MSATLMLSRVQHTRAVPTVHQFEYRVLSLCVDLDTLGASAGTVAFNRRGIFSLREADYLPGTGATIRERLSNHLRARGLRTDWGRIEMLTAPRFLGYVFNPVTFYLCFEEPSGGRAGLCVAEVNNTFGDTHLYVAEPVSDERGGGTGTFRAAKQFHVSPFYDTEGEYRFFVERLPDKIRVAVHMRRDGKTVFTSSVCGAPLSGRLGGARALAAGVIYGWLTVPRILWQAARLKWQRGLAVYSRPEPLSSDTLRSASRVVESAVGVARVAAETVPPRGGAR